MLFATGGTGTTYTFEFKYQRNNANLLANATVQQLDRGDNNVKNTQIQARINNDKLELSQVFRVLNAVASPVTLESLTPEDATANYAVVNDLGNVLNDNQLWGGGIVANLLGGTINNVLVTAEDGTTKK